MGGVCSFSGNPVWLIIVMTSPVSNKMATSKALAHSYGRFYSSSPLGSLHVGKHFNMHMHFGTLHHHHCYTLYCAMEFSSASSLWLCDSAIPLFGQCFQWGAYTSVRQYSFHNLLMLTISGLYLLWAPLSVMSTRFYLNVKDVATVDPFSPTYSISMADMRKRAQTDGNKSTTFARVSEPRTTFQTSGTRFDKSFDRSEEWWKEEFEVP